MNAQLDPVVAETNANRDTFAAFCRSLSQDELVTPLAGSPWRVKDYIAHLASIDIWVGDWFEHQADGTRWRPTGDDGGPFNIDTWNDARIDERLDATVEELLGEAAVHRERLWAAVDQFSEDVLAAQFNFRGKDITFLRYLQLWAGHDPAHSADMLRGLPARAADPALTSWIGRYGITI